MVYVEEKVRKQHAFNVNDGKDKYLHHTKGKGRIFIFFGKNSLPNKLILSQWWLIKRIASNETFATNFPFILTQLGNW